MAKKPKAPTGGKSAPLDFLLNNPDLLQQMMAALGGQSAPDDTLAELLEDFIAAHTDAEASADDDGEAIGRLQDLQSLLTDLRIAAAGGDRDAREELEAGLRVIENAADAGDLAGTAMVALFQLFGMAEVDPGNALREAFLAEVDTDGESGAPTPLSQEQVAADLAALDEEASHEVFSARQRQAAWAVVV